MKEIIKKFCCLLFFICSYIYLDVLHFHNFENKYKIISKKNNDLIINFHMPSNYKYVNSSKDYWEKRYSKGGNSGAGSYKNLALFKASIINNFVIQNNINTVIEWGSGDCNQLSLANYKNYIGYDVSQTAINICKKKFNYDKTKTFIHMSDHFTNDRKADLSISLDVIYHLLEDSVFNLYMQNLFNSSKKYVIIYSSNVDKKWEKHVRHRKFTDWIDKYISNEWKIKEYIPNKYPFDIKNQDSTSFSDFYFYEKIECKFPFFNICPSFFQRNFF